MLSEYGRIIVCFFLPVAQSYLSDKFLGELKVFHSIVFFICRFPLEFLLVLW